MFTRTNLLFALLALSCGGAGSRAADAPVIIVSSNTPLVRMVPRTRGRFIRLPSLDFELTIETDCPPDLQPASVTLSIADTRATLAGEEIAAQPPAAVAIRVPAQQIAPLAAESFCRAHDDDTDVEDVKTFPSALAAHASLRCADATGHAITYVTHPLDVAVSCEAEITDEEVPGGD